MPPGGQAAAPKRAVRKPGTVNARKGTKCKGAKNVESKGTKNVESNASSVRRSANKTSSSKGTASSSERSGRQPPKNEKKPPTNNKKAHIGQSVTSSSSAGATAGNYVEPAEDILHDELFLDREFPPDSRSLGRIDPKVGALSWDRFNGDLFQGDPCPNDIEQGALGDCYLLSALSVLAEWPERIRRIFTNPNLPPGAFCVRLFPNGHSQDTLVDNFLPIKHLTPSKPCFAACKKGCLWSALVEKAFAKAYGSYEKIASGHPSNAFADLTGAPHLQFLSRKTPKHDLWALLCKYHASNHLICACIPEESLFDARKVGLQKGHAYGLLQLKTVDNVQLLQLRNPGNFPGECTGVTLEMQNESGPCEDNGCFWLAFDFFVKYFDEVIVVFYRDDYCPLIPLEGTLTAHPQYFSFSVAGTSSVCLWLNLRFERRHGGPLVPARFCVVDSEWEPLGGSSVDYHTALTVSSGELRLAPGSYTVVVTSHSESFLRHGPQSFVLSAYAPSHCSLRLTSISEPIMENDRRPPFILPSFLKRFGRCMGCNRPLGESSGKACGGRWHKECFVCTKCKKTFGGGTFFRQEDGILCDACHRTSAAKPVMALGRRKTKQPDTLQTKHVERRHQQKLGNGSPNFETGGEIASLYAGLE